MIRRDIFSTTTAEALVQGISKGLCYKVGILTKGEALVQGISKGLCYKVGILTKGEALVQGISKGLCPLERKHQI